MPHLETHNSKSHSQEMDGMDDSASDVVRYHPDLSTETGNVRDKSKGSGVDPTWGNEMTGFNGTHTGGAMSSELLVDRNEASDHNQSERVRFSDLSNEPSTSTFSSSLNQSGILGNCSAPTNIASSSQSSTQTHPISKASSSRRAKSVSQPNAGLASRPKVLATSSQSGNPEVRWTQRSLFPEILTLSTQSIKIFRIKHHKSKPF